MAKPLSEMQAEHYNTALQVNARSPKLAGIARIGVHF
jgi:hypothetical protein